VRRRTDRSRACAYSRSQASKPTRGTAASLGAFEENFMFESLAIVLVILWLLGLVTSTTLGGFIHVLLVLAIAMVLLRIVSGRRAL
jgi:hypothetical protein